MNSAIGEALQGLQDRVAAAYTAVENKGGTIPTTQNTANLSAAIASIPSGSGPVVPVNPGYVDTIDELADYAKTCDVYGAVLSKETTGDHADKYIIWNDDPDNQTWDPRDIGEIVPTGHGTNKAVCIGDGVWLIIGWTGLTNQLKFADSSDPLYEEFLTFCVKGPGLGNSSYVLHNSGISDSGTPLWYALQQLRDANSGEFMGAYIPNAQELHDICWKLSNTADNHMGSFLYGSNIASLFSVTANGYWSSTQYPNYESYASGIRVSFANGLMSNSYKETGGYSFACLGFISGSRFHMVDDNGAEGDFLFKEGMTWNDWCGSSYDTGWEPYSSDRFYVIMGSNRVVVRTYGDRVCNISGQYGTDLIQDDAVYTIERYSNNYLFNINDEDGNEAFYVSNENATWADWVDSEYNAGFPTCGTNKFTIVTDSESGTRIVVIQDQDGFYYKVAGAHESDTIYSGSTYTLQNYNLS